METASGDIRRNIYYNYRYSNRYLHGYSIRINKKHNEYIGIHRYTDHTQNIVKTNYLFTNHQLLQTFNPKRVVVEAFY